MELSTMGFGIGAVVGMLGVFFIVKTFIPTYLDTTKEKWIRIISCVLVLAICIFLGGYIFRTEIKMGDYSHKSCSSEGCTNPPVCKFYLLGSDYYCIDHTGIVYDYLEPDRYSSERTTDRTGKGRQDAWVCAKSLVSKELKLSDAAQFCSAAKAGIIYADPYWIVRGDVTEYNDAGELEYIYFRVEFAFTGEDEVYLRDFDYDK